MESLLQQWNVFVEDHGTVASVIVEVVMCQLQKLDYDASKMFTGAPSVNLHTFNNGLHSAGVEIQHLKFEIRQLC